MGAAVLPMWEKSYFAGVVLLHRKEERESLAVSSWRYLRIILRCKYFHINSVPVETVNLKGPTEFISKGNITKEKKKNFFFFFEIVFSGFLERISRP